MRPAEGAPGHGSFRERLLLPPAFQWTIRVSAVVLLGVAVYAAATEPMGPLEGVLVLVLFVGVIGLVLMAHGRVEVLDGTLRLGLFPFWRTTLALHEVAEVDRMEVRPLAQMGVLGLGYIGGATVLALRSGEAVRVTMRDGRRYAVVLERPEDLMAAIRPERPDL